MEAKILEGHLEMRLRNIVNARKTLEKHPDLMLLDPGRRRGRWKELFGNGAPIFLEIGMGKGQFICRASERHPQINFLGLEKYDSVALRALQRFQQEPRTNVLLMRGEAENLLDYFDVGEVGRIYLNFSDPWPKKGHFKRRLTYREFLEKYKAILTPGGEIHIKTDNRYLFEFSLMQLNEFGMKFESIDLDLHSGEPKDNIRTEYENSRSASGAKIFQLICKCPLP